MTSNAIATAIVASLLIPAAALGQKVHVDSDLTATLAACKTYAWTAGTLSPNPLTEQRIHDGVDRQLAAKGLTEVTGESDLVVATHVVTVQQRELSVTGFGGGGRFGGTGTAQVERYDQGTLAVDLYDSGTRRLVWRGTASDTLSERPERNSAKINKALTKMFRRYPPHLR
jgi:hypothetical protein